jgi:hypothetical protein
MAFVGPTSNDWAWRSRRPVRAGAPDERRADTCSPAVGARVGRGLPTLVGSVVVALVLVAAVALAVRSLF